MNFKEWLILTEKIMIKDQEFRDPLLALQHIQKNHPNPENLAVTFTEINKVGLNPKSKYKTPLGIYLYPIDYLIEVKMDVPFAGDKPYINVCEFTRPQKILHMTSDKSNQKGMELLNVFPKEQVDQAIENVENVENTISSNYSKLWLVTQMLANKNPIQWNANLVKCGIDGFVDHGTGTIHMNEKTQCVVFAANNLKLLHSIDNLIFDKTYANFYSNKQNLKKFKYDINKMTDEKIINLLQSRRTLDLGSFLSSSTDKDKMAELIIKHKPDLDDNDVRALILIQHTTNKEKIAELIIKYKPNLLNVKDFIIYATNKNKMAELIIKHKPDLDDNDVRVLLQNATDKDKMAEIIINKKQKLSYKNVKDLIYSSTDKDKIAELIIKHKSDLDDNGIFYLLDYATNINKIAELIINKNPDLSDDNVYFLLQYATDKDKIAELLGTDNINKLSKIMLLDLIHLSNDKKQMAHIINKYQTNKTPEIQKILDKYLQPQTIAAK